MSAGPVGGRGRLRQLQRDVEATVMLSKSLGVDLPLDYNPFVSSDGKRALSVGEIADNLSTYVNAEAITG